MLQTWKRMKEYYEENLAHKLKKDSYVFGCVRSWLQHWGPPLWPMGSLAVACRLAAPRPSSFCILA